MEDRKPPRSVRLGHTAAEESWPPRPVDRTGLPGSGSPSAHPVDRHLERMDRRVGWVWKLLGVVAACVGFGWAGHATVAAWSARWQTAEGAEQDRDRIRKLEAQREGLELKVHDLERDLAGLRHDFDDYRARQPEPPRIGPRRNAPGLP